MPYSTSLNATAPGQYFCHQLYADYVASQQLHTQSQQQYLKRTTRRTTVEIAQHAVLEYLHGPAAWPIADSLAFRDFCSHLAERLVEVDQHHLSSPQIHHGYVHGLRPPVLQPPSLRYPTSLPRGAFWTADMIDHDTDTWSLYEGDLLLGDRHVFHFSAADVNVAVIDSPKSWGALVHEFPAMLSGITYPDWPAAARKYDAVYLTITGLLTAHSPNLPPNVVGVAEWSAVSAAWLKLPESAELAT